MAELEPELDEEEEGEEEIELTPEEKIAALKEALMNGEMGPAVFDKHYQEVWLKMKAEEQEQYRKGQRSYTADDD